MPSIDDWEMRSNRNKYGKDAVSQISIDDWEMRSNRNTRWHIDDPIGSIDDWEMRSNRNPRSVTARRWTKYRRLGNAL